MQAEDRYPTSRCGPVGLVDGAACGLAGSALVAMVASRHVGTWFGNRCPCVPARGFMAS